jgi:predicted nucleotidyltransferase
MSKAFESLVADARADPDVLAMFLYGSRASGLATIHSDHDFGVIVDDEAVSSWTARLNSLDQAEFDGRAFTLAGFEAWADWSGPERWVRYALVDAKLLVDKTGNLRGLIEAKSIVPAVEARGFINARLDHLINQTYRCAKCHRDRNRLAARLEAAEAIPPLLDVVFALDGGRIRPYAKYLAFELETRPPASLPIAPELFLENLDQVLLGSSLEVLQKLVAEWEPICRTAGYGLVFDAWGDALPWMLQFTPSQN